MNILWDAIEHSHTFTHSHIHTQQADMDLVKCTLNQSHTMNIMKFPTSFHNSKSWSSVTIGLKWEVYLSKEWRLD